MAFALFLLAQVAWADGDVPYRSEDFNKQNLMHTSSLQLMNPEGFSMQQSYTMQFAGSAMGTQSSGVYLNTLSYKFSIPLTLSMDVGLYNLFYSSMSSQFSQDQGNPNPNSSKPDIIFPSISLTYRPTSNTLLGLQVVNVRDAYRAYGPNYFWGPRSLQPGAGW